MQALHLLSLIILCRFHWQCSAARETEAHRLLEKLVLLLLSLTMMRLMMVMSLTRIVMMLYMALGLSLRNRSIEEGCGQAAELNHGAIVWLGDASNQC